MLMTLVLSPSRSCRTPMKYLMTCGFFSATKKLMWCCSMKQRVTWCTGTERAGGVTKRAVTLQVPHAGDPRAQRRPQHVALRRLAGAARWPSQPRLLGFAWFSLLPCDKKGRHHSGACFKTKTRRRGRKKKKKITHMTNAQPSRSVLIPKHPRLI